jgi:DNA repair protein RecO (recombination protein O)
MAIQKSEAIILRTIEFRETSLIVNFFTKDFGKISGLIKGIRNQPQRYGGLPLVFSRSTIVFYEKPDRDLCLVSQCDAAEQFPSIRANLKKNNYANYFVELLDAVCQDNDKNERLFNLTLDCLKTLETSDQSWQIARVFEIKLLNHSGFKPRLDACVNCQSRITGCARFSPVLGGILCASCLRFDRKAAALLKGTLACIEYIEKTGWPKVLQLKIGARISQELETILNSFLSVHLDKQIKSQKFLI